ncbi:hypothetical protein D9V29_13785 [Mycetocola manganoxydans]|uniref:DUF4097 domain-containing protein n=1 Tax=Mycetocola manganoxydans TaxID=699879 RepID=A0A3L6ZKD4_9MICO|nr:DUF4097 family beta strand repeat-containing protein [Mycetocola manganoxydans]RLP68297.1 hypothetical protein D9V29_13785 [Mycetocola manganoxydans]GHD43566.1 hypothetical protein GCM10008097_10470 [Mycetocola manganoxydans]
MTLPPQQPYQPSQPQQPLPPQQQNWPPTPPERRRRPGLMVFLFVGLPLIALALVIAVTLFAVNALNGEPVSENVDTDAGSSLFIDVPNASMDLGVSDDDEIHVSMRGMYSGTRPTLDVTTAGGETEIRGGCPSGWFVFNRCDVRIEVLLPAELDVVAGGENGAITAEALTGDLDLSTTNGRIEVDGSRGDLQLHSTNGRIELEDSRSARVEADTTNGSVSLSFESAPDEVIAFSTNGEIRIEVPDDDTEYAIEADTTNGNVDDQDVPSDRDATRSITAETTNGDVTITTVR